MNDLFILASRRRRFAATLIDALLVPSLTLLLVMITGVVEDAEDYINNLWMFWVLLLAIFSYLILNGYTLAHSGQTLGKKCLGIAIVTTPKDPQEFNEPTHKAPLWRLICIRALFFPLMFTVVVPTIFFLPLLDHLMIFTSSRRCLHDYAAGTSVIRCNQPKEPSP
jgi:uncharacterized RDD family membrane protein YckC